MVAMEEHKTVFVGNLGWNVNENDLRELGSKAGKVSDVTIFRDADSKSKGHGTISFQNEHDADAAIEILHRMVYQGRMLNLHRYTPPKTELPANIDKEKTARVLVDNLSIDTSWQDIKDAVRTHGYIPIRVDKVFDSNNQPTGRALVEFVDKENAIAAIEALNGMQLMGNQLTFRLADDSDQVVEAKGVGRGRRLYVGQLDYTVNWQTLKDYFKRIGPVMRADVMMDGHRSKGYGFVEFVEASDAQKAIEQLNKSILNNRRIIVRPDRTEP